MTYFHFQGPSKYDKVFAETDIDVPVGMDVLFRLPKEGARTAADSTGTKWQVSKVEKVLMYLDEERPKGIPRGYLDTHVFLAPVV